VKTLRNKADKLWSLMIRQRDGHCRRCGTTENLQAAHVISRRYKAIRWDPRNGICLCRGCHHWNHHHPVEFDWWVQDLIGKDTYESLRSEALNYVRELKRTDLQEVVAGLQKEVAA
jgi:hypothetical protein